MAKQSTNLFQPFLKAIAVIYLSVSTMVAPQLIPKPKEPPQGLRQLLMQLSCAFGNSLTLPLVFLFALLPEAAANQSVAFVALLLAVRMMTLTSPMACTCSLTCNPEAEAILPPLHGSV